MNSSSDPKFYGDLYNRIRDYKGDPDVALKKDLDNKGDSDLVLKANLDRLEKLDINPLQATATKGDIDDFRDAIWYFRQALRFYHKRKMDHFPDYATNLDDQKAILEALNEQNKSIISFLAKQITLEGGHTNNSIVYNKI